MEQDSKKKEDFRWPLDDHFRIIPKLKTDLTPFFERVSMNVNQRLLEIDVRERKDFAVLNWIMDLADDENEEALTFISHDGDGKILCMLVFENISLIHHECTFQKGVGGAFGIDTGDTAVHEIHVAYKKMERVREPKV